MIIVSKIESSFQALQQVHLKFTSFSIKYDRIEDIPWFSDYRLWVQGPSWSWLYGSWIYHYLRNQCLSSLTLWVRTPLRLGVPDTNLCDKVCQCITTGRWFSPDTPVSSTNKTDRHHITEILLNVALNTTTQPGGNCCLMSNEKYNHDNSGWHWRDR